MTRPISIVYADPPWPFKTYSSKASDKTGNGQRRMEWSDLMRIGPLLKPHLDRKAYLLLWMPKNQAVRAEEMAALWGFSRIISAPAFTWVKQNPSGKFPMGTGFVTRGNPEGCWLFGRELEFPIPHKTAIRVLEGLQYWGPERGKPAFVPRELQFHPPGSLWSKPPEIRRLIERMWPGDIRRVELFARPQEDLDQSVWECYGDEMDGLDIYDAFRAGLASEKGRVG